MAYQQSFDAFARLLESGEVELSPELVSFVSQDLLCEKALRQARTADFYQA